MERLWKVKSKDGKCEVKKKGGSASKDGSGSYNGCGLYFCIGNIGKPGAVEVAVVVSCMFLW